jgi:DNA-nicking Smr family endonuclease
MKPPRGLSAEEAALWARVAATVKPLNPPRALLGEGDQPKAGGGGSRLGATSQDERQAESPLRQPPQARRLPPPRPGEDQLGLDSTWDRRLARGTLAPDFTLDLHGQSRHTPQAQGGQGQ